MIDTNDYSRAHPRHREHSFVRSAIARNSAVRPIAAQMHTGAEST